MHDALKALKSEYTYHYFIENHPAIIMMLDAENGDIIDVNKSAIDFYGYNYDDFTSMNISDINTYSKEEIYVEIKNANEENRNFFVFNHQIASGELKSVQVYSYPIDYKEKKVLFSLIAENHKDNNESPSIDQVLYESLEIRLMIDHTDFEQAKILYANKSFTEIVESEFDIIGHYFSEVCVISEQLDEHSYLGYMSSINSGKILPISMVTSEVRYAGERYLMLAISIEDFQNVKAIDKDEILKKTAHWNDLEGYLVRLDVYSVCHNPKMCTAVMETLEKNLEDYCAENDLWLKLITIGSSIFMYFKASIQDIVLVCELLLNDIKYHEHSQSRNMQLTKTRIAISAHSKYGERQLADVSNTMETFSPHEYDAVHVSSKKYDYYRTQDVRRDFLDGIEKDQMELYYQNIVDYSTETINSIEFLVRWNHPEHGLVMPNEFIKYAEITNNIKALDLWVIQHAFKFIEDVTIDNPQLLYHINVSCKSIIEDEVVSNIIKWSENLDRKAIVLEITEYSNVTGIDKVIKKLKDLEFKFAIDDFGKGYSSFERIKNLHFDYIKIDKSFIDNITSSVEDLQIIKTIISMCFNLNINIIAEGVENIQQLEFLEAKNCNLIQGYLLSRPAPIKNFTVAQENTLNILHELSKTVNLDEKYAREYYLEEKILIQDFETDLSLTPVNIKLMDILGVEYGPNKKVTMSDILETSSLSYLSRLVEIDFDIPSTVMLMFCNAKKECIGSLCTIQKKDFDAKFRMYIDFIEEDKEFQSELMGLSKSYLQVFHEAPSAMMILDENYNVKRWNESAEVIFGYSTNEVIGMNLIKVISPPNDHEKLNLTLNESVKFNVSEGVINSQKKNGDEVICRWHVRTIFDKTTSHYLFICIANDITDSLRQHRYLTKVNKAIDQSPSMVYMTNREGDIEFANQRMLDVTGYKLEEILGKNPRIFSSGQQNKYFYRQLWTTIQNGGVWSGEMLNAKKNGETFWVQSSILPLKEDDDFVGFICMQTDITEQKELLNLNDNLKNRLFEQDKIASLGLLTSGIAHEINNPLAYINGNTEYLVERLTSDGDLDDELRADLLEVLSDINQGVQQISDIAKGLKKYVFKKEDEEKAVINIVDELRTVLLITKNEYKYYANVSIETDEDAYYVEAYASKLKQVFMNLIINATHAIMDTDSNDLGTIVIKVNQSEDMVYISLKDTGKGIPEEVLAHIFEPFFTTKEEGVGTGLGLSISKQIIEEEHGGLIECNSEVGVGTEFKISLPCKDDYLEN